MSRTEETDAAQHGTVVEEYVKDVRILEVAGRDSEGGTQASADDGADGGATDRVDDGVDDDVRYRFEAPLHCGMTFEDRESATLYADVYFAVNGFREDGSGEIGIPPEIVQAGKDTMAAYLLAVPSTTDDWVASFYGTTPGELQKYVGWVRNRAEEIRAEAREQGIE